MRTPEQIYHEDIATEREFVWKAAGKFFPRDLDSRDDLVQNVMFAAWRFRAKFDGRSPRGWLRVLVRQQGIDMYRTERTKGFDLFKDPDADWLNEPSTEDTYFDEKLEPHFEAVLKHLGDTDQALVARVVAGETKSDIAREMGVSRQAIDQRFRRMAARVPSLLSHA